jgi:hypothetical protein
VYTVLLVIALLSIIVSCVFLYLYMADYKFQFKGGPPPPAASLGASSGVQVATAMEKLRIKNERGPRGSLLPLLGPVSWEG